MTYTLFVIFLLSGDAYVERTGLSLQACAGQAAMARQAIPPELTKSIGDVQFRCVEERPISVTENANDR